MTSRLVARSLPVLVAMSLLWAHNLCAEEADPSILPRYTNSTLTDRTAEAAASYALVTGLVVRDMQFESQRVDGKVTRLTYKNPPNASTAEIFRFYKDTLVRSGARLLFSCDLATCGPAYARGAWGRLNGLVVASEGDPRYVAARLIQGETQYYAAVMVGGTRTQVDIVEQPAAEKDLLTLDATALSRSLDETGSATVYGISFDPEKSALRPESKHALDIIAELLRAQPGLSLYVVVHSDMSGSLERSLQLSHARARVLGATLVKEYGIAASRVEGHGAGPLAPVATNTTDKGRELNRRVVLVKR